MCVQNFTNYNQFHNILGLFDILPSFAFTTSERCAIIPYKHGINELPNDLRLRLGSKEIKKYHEIV